MKVMEIGDLSEEESINYLVDKRELKEEDAKRLYELVGGRIIDLKQAADKLLAGQKFEAIKQQILFDVKKKFRSAQLLPNDLHYEVGKRVISDLLKSKELDFFEFKKYFNKVEELNKLLESNIFAYHPEENTVSFKSQSIEYYARKNLDLFT
ncbi:P-loop containing nucleoside triphosphate hydrolase protein [Rhizophagus clarus]|nr:P-loop containing nucleoside triphosphate hydrolase protein [Rhizophagus clarus]